MPAGFPSATSYQDRNVDLFTPQPAVLSSGLDQHSVYHPPSVLQLPGAATEEDVTTAKSRPESPHSTSSSHSDLSSPSFNRDSELEFGARLRGDAPGPVRTDATVSEKHSCHGNWKRKEVSKRL